jgi:hypothetical protein
VLSGADRSPQFEHLTTSDRAAILQILEATKPDFARTLAAHTDAGRQKSRLLPAGTQRKSAKSPQANFAE